MESKLFSWTSWDISNINAFFFYDIELKEKIGDFDIGTKFKSALINYETGELEFYNYNSDSLDVELIGKFKIELIVVK